MFITVGELPEYQRRAGKLLTVDERQEVVNYLAAFPREGDLIRNTGGVRKLRWLEAGAAKAPVCG